MIQMYSGRIRQNIELGQEKRKALFFSEAPKFVFTISNEQLKQQLVALIGSNCIKFIVLTKRK